MNKEFRKWLKGLLKSKEDYLKERKQVMDADSQELKSLKMIIGGLRALLANPGKDE